MCSDSASFAPTYIFFWNSGEQEEFGFFFLISLQTAGYKHAGMSQADVCDHSTLIKQGVYLVFFIEICLKGA